MRLTGGEGVDLVIDALGPTSFRKDYRLLRPGGRLVMYGLSEATNGGGRDIPAALKSLAKMPLATMPWWKSLALMNENKGVFGLNMLKLVGPRGQPRPRHRAADGRPRGGRLEPVVAAAFPFERAGEAHEFIAERRNVGKVVLFPSRTSDRLGGGRFAMKKAILITLAMLAAQAARRSRTPKPTYTVVLAGGPAQNTIRIWLTPDGRSYVIDSVVPLEVGGDGLRKPARNPERADLQGAAGRRLRSQRRRRRRHGHGLERGRGPGHHARRPGRRHAWSAAAAPTS